MKILVLGSEGMLGRYVYRYLKESGHDVLLAPHVDINSSILGIDALWSYDRIRKVFKDGYEISEGDVVINCIGIIKPQIEGVGIENTININSIFPHALSGVCFFFGLHLLQISSDCVYSGSKGNYSETDPHDATDIYGKTKSLGEPENATVIRTSIIGEEKYNKRSLLEWVKSNKGNTIGGYANHYWNGVTCLRLAQVIEEIIIENKYWKGVKHVFGEVVSKMRLLQLINEVYDLGITVAHTFTDDCCDRTLTTNRKDVEFPVYNLLNDLVKQKEFGV